MPRRTVQSSGPGSGRAHREELTRQKLKQAMAHQGKGELSIARSICEKILRRQPRNAEAAFLLGVNALLEGNHSLAAGLLGRAVEIRPGNAVFHANHGIALRALGKQEAAIAAYEKALAIRPDYTEVLVNHGTAMLDSGRADKALSSFDRALAVQPDHPGVHYNRGNALRELRQLDAALESYDRALTIKPDLTAAWLNRGSVLVEKNNPGAAIECFDRALAIDHDHANTHYNRGIALLDLKLLDQAEESFRKALELDPEFDYLTGLLLNTKMKTCDWRDFTARISELRDRIMQGEKVIGSLEVLALTDDPEIQLRVAEIRVNDKHPEEPSLGPVAPGDKGDKIRLAYFSPDFRNHPVSILAAGLFEQHDRSRFEINAFSIGSATGDPMRTRLESAFDQFIDISDRDDRGTALLCREMGIDIAIDLGGHTTNSRPGVFAHRAAPIQVNYLGFPGTMGAAYMDYLIADEYTVPASCRDKYTEKIAYLPCFQANDDLRETSPRTLTRQELGLPDSGFVFCCLNNNYKIIPSVFDSWLNILEKVEDSVLLLLADNTWAEQNIRKAAARKGLGPNRIVFAQRLPYPDYLARYRSADLFLDTFPFNGGSTASDALWSGLPVMTRCGRAFASRMAASLLNAVGLPELVTDSQAAYEDLAVELASSPSRMRKIRTRLDEHRAAGAPFNTSWFTGKIEDAFSQMYAKHRDGSPPDHILVASERHGA